LTHSLAVVTAYFNFQHYETKGANLQRFRQGLLRQGVPLVIIECAFGEDPFELPDQAGVIRVRSRSILWQKERLLNIAVESLPATCTKVAWVDCDLLFENDAWADEASHLLETHAVVQLFECAVRLSRGAESDVGKDLQVESFGAAYQRNPRLAHTAWFSQHGHTGFAWAARRQLWDCGGLYETALSGVGDHVMAHVFVGATESSCLQRTLGRNEAQLRDLRHWSRNVTPTMGGHIGVVPGKICHLWHGDPQNRQYDRRAQELTALGYDPAAHLAKGSDGCWEWSTENPRLAQWAREFFRERHEDGGRDRRSGGEGK
jgi:hypothetical protein